MDARHFCRCLSSSLPQARLRSAASNTLSAHQLHHRPDPTHVPSDPSPPEEIVQFWNQILESGVSWEKIIAVSCANMRVPTDVFADRILSALPVDTIPSQRVQWSDDDGRTWVVNKTTHSDGFVEVFAKSVHKTSVQKAWVYRRSQNPTAKGIKRADWVVQVYA
jgi:hypothetical protein